MAEYQSPTRALPGRVKLNCSLFLTIYFFMCVIYCMTVFSVWFLIYRHNGMMPMANSLEIMY